jgi:hypothetical protein
VESQKAKAGRFLASHSDSRPLPFPTLVGPDRAHLFGGTGLGTVIPGTFPA